MVASRAMAGIVGAVSALALVLSASAGAATPRNLRVQRPASIALGDGGIGSFTPAAADPRRGAAMTLAGVAATGFRFTPSTAPGRRRAVTVAVRARMTPRLDTTRADVTHNVPLAGSTITPTAYNLGIAVGWKRFALTGDVARLDTGLVPLGREAVDLGLSYSGRQWSTRVLLGADRTIGDRPVMIGDEKSYSVDLGGSYALTRNLDVTGGVRYKLQRDRVSPVTDELRDSQAVYVGTAFRF